MSFISVKDYAAKHKVSLQTVYKKIRKAGTELDGHIIKSGGCLVLDEIAEEKLKPRTRDCYLIEKIETLKKQAEQDSLKIYNLTYERDGIRKKYEDRQTDTERQDEEIARLKNLLYEADGQIADMKSRLDGKDTQIYFLKNDLDGRDKKIAELEKILSEHNSRFEEFEKRAAALTEENLKLSAQLCTLSDEILERDKRIEILETPEPAAEAPKNKNIFGFKKKVIKQG